MAINLLENASTTAPVDNTDWVNAQALVSANQAPQRSILTSWASTDALPSLKQGSFIRYEGNTYQIQSNDAAISGSISAGVNYIVMTASGTVLTASLTNDLTDYAYDPAYGGVYNGDLMLLRDIVYYSSSAYNRGWSLSGADFNSWVLASGQAMLAGAMAVGGAITGASASISGAIYESGSQLGLGVNQTWHNVTSSRVVGTTYTNSNDKPIQVSVTTNRTEGSHTLSFIIGSITIASSSTHVDDEDHGNITLSYIVPAGSSYSVSTTSSGSTLPTLSYWAELY